MLLLFTDRSHARRTTPSSQQVFENAGCPNENKMCIKFFSQITTKLPQNYFFPQCKSPKLKNQNSEVSEGSIAIRSSR